MSLCCCEGDGSSVGRIHDPGITGDRSVADIEVIYKPSKSLQKPLYGGLGMGVSNSRALDTTYIYIYIYIYIYTGHYWIS